MRVSPGIADVFSQGARRLASATGLMSRVPRFRSRLDVLYGYISKNVKAWVDSMSARVYSLSPARVSWVSALGELAEIREPDLAMVVAQRDADAGIAAYLAGHGVSAGIRSIRLTATPGESFRSNLGDRLPPGDGRQHLVHDVDLLAAAFCLLCGLLRVDLRLEVLRDLPQHPGFRPEAGPARMSCVYGAPGIRWRDGPWLASSHARTPNLTDDAATVPPSAVAVFKGARWHLDRSARVYVAEPARSEELALHLSITPV